MSRDRATDTYRPWLDGLRAVAIGWVLVSHFGGRHVPTGSGEVGVGLFFALSGYLITGLLLDEHRRGGVDLPAFYARRAGRLFPGLLLMVIVTAPLLAIFVSPGNAIRSTIGAMTYTSNYGDITGLIPHNQYLQTWSLAIEEHFYLCWAPVLIWAAKRGGPRTVLRAAVVGSVTCAVSRDVVAASYGSWEWVARGTALRGDALLVGCAAAAAIRCGVRVPRWVLCISLPALFALLWVLPSDGHGPTLRLAVGLTFLSLAGAGAVAGLDGSATRIRRILSLRPAVWLGTRSYSIYLWHYPLLVLLVGHLPNPAILCISLGAAEASYRFVEKPARSAVRVWVATRRRPKGLGAQPSGGIIAPPG